MGIKGSILRKRSKKRNPKAWIFCEGESEKAYFEELKSDSANDLYRLSNITIEKIFSHGAQAKELIDFAIKKNKYLSQSNQIEPMDTVWLVFDRDENQDKVLEQVSKLAKENNFRILYSNPCFEFWYRLHFGYTDRPYQHSQSCKAEIKEIQYLPGYVENKSFYSYLGNEKLEVAKKAARRLVAKHQNSNNSIFSAKSHPISTIYEFFDFLDNQAIPN